MKHWMLALALLIVLPASAASQSGGGSNASVMTRAIGAYQDLDFDVAATLLRRVLANAPDDSTRIRALTYLGAAEHYRGREDSAEAVFRRLIVLAPEQRPDTVVFPPEVTRLYDDVQSRTRVVTVVVPPVPVPVPVRAALPVLDTVAAAPTAQSPESPPVLRSIMPAGAGELVHVRAQSSGGVPPASGTVLGMSASVRYGRFELGVRYLQGSLQSRDLVEGAAALRFAATPWLTLDAGRQIRRYEMPAGAERWMTWQIGARVEAPVLVRVRAHALLWRGLGLSVNVPPGSGTAQGGEVGWRIDVPGPFWLGLTYAIDQASLHGGGRRETVEAFVVTAGLRRLP